EWGIHLYYSKKYASAEEIFKNVLEQNNQDKAASLYVKRCQRLQKQGTDERWDEIESFEEAF
ncbi:adenylate/guanylate cyclase domain-containing response regulator, partial [Coleofasciculus sp. FACHB-SPT36]|nr:adenylate/guanylate cyclase domain-containing response regulator [Coleofasciculus sp. FACHB-SPT36]